MIWKGLIIIMKNKLNIVTNVLIIALFILAAMVAVYIVRNNAAPWHWISTYWITLSAKNGLDCISRKVKK